MAATSERTRGLSICTPCVTTALGKPVIEECELGKEGVTLAKTGFYYLTTRFSGMIRLKLWGAGGGGGTNRKGSRGSAGGYTEAVIPVVDGEAFTVVIGEGGMGGGVGVAASQTPSFPDGSVAGTYESWHVGGCGGGSTRFAQGHIKKELLNHPSSEYLLIAGGGGGGADWIHDELNTKGVSSWQGLDQCGEGGGLNGGFGSLFYLHASADGESKTSPGGGGSQAAGGAGGTHGRLADGQAGSKYQAGASTGAGSGGGYYGGGGSAGYYAQGGGGSGYISPSVTIQARSLRGGTGIPGMMLPHFTSFPEGRPTVKTGCGGDSVGTDIEGLRGGDGALVLTFVHSRSLLSSELRKPDGTQRSFQLTYGVQTITLPISVSVEFLQSRLGVAKLPSTVLILPDGEEFDLASSACRSQLTDLPTVLEGDSYPLAPPFLHVYHTWTTGEIACAQQDQAQCERYFKLLGIHSVPNKRAEYVRFPIPESLLAVDLLSLFSHHYHMSSAYPSSAWYVWLQKKDRS